MKSSTNINILILFLFLSSPSLAQYNKLRETFNILTTIAGKGNFDEKGYNGWQSSFENGLAIDAELSRPHIAMADSAGNIFIADKDAHAIRKVDLNGIITTVAGTNNAGDNGDGLATEHQLNAPNGIWVNPKGEFYILDLNNNKIRKVDTKGQMTTIIHDETGMGLGRGLWVSKTEDTIWYCCTNAIKQWTATTGINTLSDGFLALGNIVQAPNGNIMATDRSDNKAFIINLNGTKTHIAGNGIGLTNEGMHALETPFYGVRGIWCINDGTYFLATHEGSQVWYVDSDSIAHLFLDGKEGDEYHNGDGQYYGNPGYKVSEVRAITIDNKGNMYITENDRGFIRKIEKKLLSEKIDFLNSVSKHIWYTNPVHNQLNININLDKEAEIAISVLNQNGQEISVIEKGNHFYGFSSFHWDRTTNPLGIYYLKVKIDKNISLHKIILR